MRKLDLDGTPLRRRTDKIAGRLAALPLVAFLIGAPVLAVAAWAAVGPQWTKRSSRGASRGNGQTRQVIRAGGRR